MRAIDDRNPTLPLAVDADGLVDRDALLAHARGALEKVKRQAAGRPDRKPKR